jgi:hypothetical protein
MSTGELRREIKKAIDRVPADRLESLADYVDFLKRPSLRTRLEDAEKQISAGEGKSWRAVRSDV